MIQNIKSNPNKDWHWFKKIVHCKWNPFKTELCLLEFIYFQKKNSKRLFQKHSGQFVQNSYVGFSSIMPDIYAMNSCLESSTWSTIAKVQCCLTWNLAGKNFLCDLVGHNFWPRLMARAWIHLSSPRVEQPMI
jgi:hypothetical protein